MNFKAKLVAVFDPDIQGGNSDYKISFYLGRKKEIVNIFLGEKEIEKFIEDLMRVVWEYKLKTKKIR